MKHSVDEDKVVLASSYMETMGKYATFYGPLVLVEAHNLLHVP